MRRPVELDHLRVGEEAARRLPRRVDRRLRHAVADDGKESDVTARRADLRGDLGALREVSDLLVVVRPVRVEVPLAVDPRK